MPTPMNTLLNEPAQTRHLVHGALLSDAITRHLADLRRLQAQVRQIDQNAARLERFLAVIEADLDQVRQRLHPHRAD